MWRNATFSAYGLLYFTKQAFERQKLAPLPDGADLLRGKTLVVTGANNGIGKEVALQFAQRGGTVFMVCRNVERGESAKEEIVQASRNPDVHLLIADMSRPTQVQAMVEEYRRKYGGKPVDVLVNNAGVLLQERKRTPEGLEESFATNVVGPYLLTKLLLPELQKCPSRVINVSSGGMYTRQLDTKDLQLDKLEPFDGATVYAHQKRQLVLMSAYFAKTFPSQVQVFSCHPAWVDTPGVETSLPSFHRALKNRLRTLEQGADTIVWLAINTDQQDALAAGNGRFWFDRQVAREHLPLAFTESSEQDVVEMVRQLEEICRPYLASSQQ